NTSWGVQALSPSSTGTGNVANGAQALYLNTTGYSNVANGMQSLYSNTSGYWNVANGVQSLYSNTTGYYNVANGFVALYSNTTGTVNVANGFAALYSNTTGYGNVADGQGALYYNTTGATNTAVGNGALSNNTIGIAGVAVGSGALSLNTTGNQNTAIGNEALLSITTGGYNIGVGTGAGGFNSTGYYNTSVGGGAGPYVDGLNNTSAFGSDTYTYASNTMAFGDTTTIGWGFAAARPTATNVFVVGTTSSNGNGAYLTAGGVWTNASDQNLKEDFTTPDSKDVLSRIKKMSVTKWKYKGTSEYHVGPMAQDFYSAFNLGTDNKHISTIDPAGVALIAIQELATQNDSLQSANTQQQEINAQQQQANNNLQQQLNDLKTTISQMQTAMSQCCNSYSSNMTKEAASPLVVTGADAARLQQNAPNPYTGSTVIAYHLPQSTTNAEIIVSDLTGSVIKSVSLTGTGDGQITLSAGSLASGSYFYTLLVNGQKIDTKQMIIAQ
ncbi:MAG TPA: tail fiber domain-containing protein, partial [Bacteroidia bacterium]|nr:tail fiber domain-containing protein [Bacteroidia bacterium]